MVDAITPQGSLNQVTGALPPQEAKPVISTEPQREDHGLHEASPRDEFRQWLEDLRTFDPSISEAIVPLGLEIFDRDPVNSDFLVQCLMSQPSLCPEVLEQLKANPSKAASQIVFDAIDSQQSCNGIDDVVLDTPSW